MSQLPFTPQGVRQKQEELYQLSEGELLIQAREVSLDLRSWVETNFALNRAQKDYFSKVPEKTVFTWGAQLSAALANRGEITMDPLPDYNNQDNGERPKEIKVKDEGETDYSPEGRQRRTEGGARETGTGPAAAATPGATAETAWPATAAPNHRVSIEWKLL